MVRKFKKVSVTFSSFFRPRRLNVRPEVASNLTSASSFELLEIEIEGSVPGPSFRLYAAAAGLNLELG